MGNDNGGGSGKGRFGVSFDKRKRKYFEKRWVHISPDFIILFFFPSDQTAKIPDSDGIHNFRKFLIERRAHWDGDNWPYHTIILIIHVHSADVFGIFMEPVKVQFILNPQKDQNTDGHADGQSGNVDERVPFMSFHIPESNF